MKTLALVNKKGGLGKTTSAVTRLGKVTPPVR
jgi:cellulose biosynthesis protein BcsQ